MARADPHAGRREGPLLGAVGQDGASLSQVWTSGWAAWLSNAVITAGRGLLSEMQTV